MVSLVPAGFKVVSKVTLIVSVLMVAIEPEGFKVVGLKLDLLIVGFELKASGFKVVLSIVKEDKLDPCGFKVVSGTVDLSKAYELEKNGFKVVSRIVEPSEVNELGKSGFKVIFDDVELVEEEELNTSGFKVVSNSVDPTTGDRLDTCGFKVVSEIVEPSKVNGLGASGVKVVSDIVEPLVSNEVSAGCMKVELSFKASISKVRPTIVIVEMGEVLGDEVVSEDIVLATEEMMLGSKLTKAVEDVELVFVNLLVEGSRVDGFTIRLLNVGLKLEA